MKLSDDSETYLWIMFAIALSYIVYSIYNNIKNDSKNNPSLAVNISILILITLIAFSAENVQKSPDYCLFSMILTWIIFTGVLYFLLFNYFSSAHKSYIEKSKNIDSPKIRVTRTYSQYLCVIAIFVFSMCQAALLLKYHHDMSSKNGALQYTGEVNKKDRNKNFTCEVNDNADNLEALITPTKCIYEYKKIEPNGIIPIILDDGDGGIIERINITGFSNTNPVDKKIVEVKSNIELMDLEHEENVVIAAYRANEMLKILQVNESIRNVPTHVLLAPERCAENYRGIQYQGAGAGCAEVTIDIYYKNKSDLTLLDALYFVAYTMTTTGYGDWIPVDDFTKFFTILMNLHEFIFIALILSMLQHQFTLKNKADQN